MNAFVDELKRRRVVRVALVYTATAFVVLQAADLLSAGLALPSWIFGAITVVTVLGFPLALVLSWAFDITATGVQRTSPTTAQATWLGRGTLLAAGALIALGVVLATGWITPAQPAAAAPGANGATTYVLGSIRSAAVDVRMLADRFAVSPDGGTIALVGLDRSGVGGLLLRRRDQLEPVLLPGTTDRAISPAFSPDGRWIAYVDTRAGALMKVPVAHGPPVRITVTGGGNRLSWGADDRIRVSVGHALVSVHASTGSADTLAFGADTAIVRGEQLPRGRLLLSLVIADTLERIVVRERNGRLRDLLEGFDARTSSSGRVIFARREGPQHVLMSTTLKLRSATLDGETVVVLRDAPVVQSTPAALTAAGDLVHLAGLDRADRRIVMLDRRGFEREIASAERPWLSARPSPDGSLIAAVSWEPGGRRIWSINLHTSALSPVTRAGDTFSLRWHPDSRQIFYTNVMDQNSSGSSMMRAPADGSAAGTPVLTERNAYVQDVTGDGRHLVFRGGGGAHIWPMHPDSAPRPLLPPRLDASAPTFSPDSRWLVFLTTASGRRELRIGPAADPTAAVPVTRGDVEPIGWSRDGRFFYQDGEAVWSVRPGRLQAEAVRAFTLPRDVVGIPSVLPDGEHLVLVRGGDLYSDLVLIEAAPLRRAGAPR